jgi:hypothetical protein
MAAESSNHPQFLQKPNVLVTAYLFHLALPTFLLLGVLTAWGRGKIALGLGGTECVVSGLSALWLVAGLGILFLSRVQQIVRDLPSYPSVSQASPFSSTEPE